MDQRAAGRFHTAHTFTGRGVRQHAKDIARDLGVLGQFHPAFGRKEEFDETIPN